MQIDKERYKNIFDTAKARYGGLQNVPIELHFTKNWFFTMRTSVKFWSLFKKDRIYIVIINTAQEKNILSKLSNTDVFAWFGHELAHIVEYSQMTKRELLWFFIKYVFNTRFRFSVERRVNVLACKHGFMQELIGVWQKFLTLDSISPRYKKYITQNYLPELK